MTRDKLMKYKLTGYMEITVKYPGDRPEIPCLLVQVNYDTEVFIVRPIPTGPYRPFSFENEDFPVHISMCEIARPRLKALK